MGMNDYSSVIQYKLQFLAQHHLIKPGSLKIHSKDARVLHDKRLSNSFIPGEGLDIIYLIAGTFQTQEQKADD